MTLSKLAMVSAAMAVPAALPACSTNSGTPCRCPSGSEYAESSTYTVIGAAAKDVTALISDCACAIRDLE